MKQKLLFELVWWLITAVLIILVLLPIYSSIGLEYPFYQDNILVLIIAVTLARYIFFLKHHWISYSNKIKVVFIFIPIGIFLYLLDTVYDFQSFMDEEGLKSIMSNLDNKRQIQLSSYIKTEMILFWVVAFLSNILMPFRMLISIWKKINKNVD